MGKSRLAATEWRTVTPNEHGDWINQRNAAFYTLRALSPDKSGISAGGAPVFLNSTIGLVSARDAWCFNSSEAKLRANVRLCVDFYNEQTARFQATNPAGSLAQRKNGAKAFVSKDARKFHWNDEAYRDVANGVFFSVDESGFRVAAYRPFFKQRLYFNPQLVTSIRDFPQIFPGLNTYNLGISITGLASNSAFHTLMTDCIAEYCLTAVNSAYLPRWRYIVSDAALRDSGASDLMRVSNINPRALAEFRAHYEEDAISEDDVFYYTYGVLHSAQWRDAFANDLVKSQARIPMAASAADFHAFAKAGRDLADMHVNYESVEPYPLDEIHPLEWNPDAPTAYRVEKMGYPGGKNPDRTRIEYNADMTLAGIPAKAHEYRLGSRSALDWLVERYRVSTDKSGSGITNDPNDWSAEVGDRRYIFDLIKRVTTVSVRTVDIVAGLPELGV